jgi:hypothetical protein
MEPERGLRVEFKIYATEQARAQNRQRAPKITPKASGHDLVI